jgi:inosose dehydratase
MPIRVACHTFNWLPFLQKQGRTPDIETILNEVADAGYDAVELTGAPMEIDDPAKTARLLQKLHLQPAGMSFHFRAAAPGLDEPKRRARILADLGAKVAVLFDATDWQAASSVAAYAPSRSTPELLDAFAEFVASLGLDAVVHNHLRTNLETPAQLDSILPRLRSCGFCLDTGHLIAAGGDPTPCIAKYARLLRHVHFKDVCLTPEGKFLEFVELGAGNHPHRMEDMLKALRAVSYDGWLVLEQDQTRTTPFESARANRQFLGKLGL